MSCAHTAHAQQATPSAQVSAPQTLATGEKTKLRTTNLAPATDFKTKGKESAGSQVMGDFGGGGAASGMGTSKSGKQDMNHPGGKDSYNHGGGGQQDSGSGSKGGGDSFKDSGSGGAGSSKHEGGGNQNQNQNQNQQDSGQNKEDGDSGQNKEESGNNNDKMPNPYESAAATMHDPDHVMNNQQDMRAKTQQLQVKGAAKATTKAVNGKGQP